MCLCSWVCVCVCVCVCFVGENDRVSDRHTHTHTHIETDTYLRAHGCAGVDVDALQAMIEAADRSALNAAKAATTDAAQQVSVSRIMIFLLFLFLLLALVQNNTTHTHTHTDTHTARTSPAPADSSPGRCPPWVPRVRSVCAVIMSQRMDAIQHRCEGGGRERGAACQGCPCVSVGVCVCVCVCVCASLSLSLDLSLDLSLSLSTSLDLSPSTSELSVRTQHACCQRPLTPRHCVTSALELQLAWLLAAPCSCCLLQRRFCGA